jgi:hypothetical protein
MTRLGGPRYADERTELTTKKSSFFVQKVRFRMIYVFGTWRRLRLVGLRELCRICGA